MKKSDDSTNEEISIPQMKKPQMKKIRNMNATSEENLSINQGTMHRKKK